MESRQLKKKDFEKFYEMEKDFARDNKKLVKQKIFQYDIVKSECKKDFLKKVVAKNGYFFAIEDKEKLVGYIYGAVVTLPKGYGAKEMGYINKLYTNKKYRGLGLATKLVDDYLRFLKREKIMHCSMNVSVDNTHAFEIYKHFGFKPFEYKMLKELKS
jgi:ribosomal protein S18 acetylase RimI-like enzyme